LKIPEHILKIEKKIWIDLSTENRIGLYLGLSGVILFYDSMNNAYPSEEFNSKLITVIEKVNGFIENKQNSNSLCSGLAGYGLSLLRLESISINISEDYFESIDNFLLEDFELLCESNCFDFMHEGMGIAMYYIERYRSSKNDAITNVLYSFAEKFIYKINNDFGNVLLKSDESRGRYYSFGLAHGVASYLNFLIYLKTHFAALDTDICEALRVCVDFLSSYKQYDSLSKQHYPNILSIETNQFMSSRLSWCQGDLGVSNALYNTGVFLDNTLIINEAIELMNHSASISFEDSGVDDFGVCHGSAGILIQFFLASKKYNIDYSQEIDRWYKTLKNQTKNFEECLWYDNSTEEYFPEINLLVGSVGLGMTLLTIEGKIDSKWLEILCLY
jgi:lantibiotic modifying enzyme